MLRAEVRLEEAEFFLEKLKTTNGKGKEFIFYLSALTSATRSIGFVLQKDLRAKNQEKFNEWWEQIKKTVSVDPFPFETIQELRNTLQKEGHKLPIVWRIEGDAEGIIIDHAVDLFDGNDHFFSMKIHFTELTTFHRSPDETNEEFEARIWEETKELAFSKIISVASRLPELNSYSMGFELPDERVYDFETLVSGFENHLSCMQIVIDQANLLFGGDT